MNANVWLVKMGKYVLQYYLELQHRNYVCVFVQKYRFCKHRGGGSLLAELKKAWPQACSLRQRVPCSGARTRQRSSECPTLVPKIPPELNIDSVTN